MTRILAFDTSGPYCAACVTADGAVLALREQPMQKGQAEHLMPMVQDVLSTAALDWGDLDAIAVGTGPGNFTGIRISVAAARGLALAARCPAIGISILEAHAAGVAGQTTIALEARRAQVVVQDFENGAATAPPRIAAQQEAEAAGHVIRPNTTAPITAIARVAARRIGADNPRPTPLYVRAPDAEISRHPVPRILP